MPNNVFNGTVWSPQYAGAIEMQMLQAQQLRENMARQRMAATQAWIAKQQEQEVANFLAPMAQHRMAAAAAGQTPAQFAQGYQQQVAAHLPTTNATPQQQAAIMAALDKFSSGVAVDYAKQGNYVASDSVTKPLGQMPIVSQLQQAAAANNPGAVAGIAQANNPFASADPATYSPAVLAAMQQGGSPVQALAAQQKAAQEQANQMAMFQAQLAARGGQGGAGQPGQAPQADWGQALNMLLLKGIPLETALRAIPQDQWQSVVAARHAQDQQLGVPTPGVAELMGKFTAPQSSAAVNLPTPQSSTAVIPDAYPFTVAQPPVDLYTQAIQPQQLPVDFYTQAIQPQQLPTPTLDRRAASAARRAQEKSREMDERAKKGKNNGKAK